MLYVGLDENGLGPRLGPLVVTLVSFAADAKRASLRRMLGAHLGDSKGLVSFSNSALGESWARALAVRLGCRASSPAELLDFLLVSKDRSLSLCPAKPSSVARQCWSRDDDPFVADEDCDRSVERVLGKMSRAGFELRELSVRAVCTKELNVAARAGRSRFAVDFLAMEELIVSASKRTGEPIDVVAGKVGGYGDYEPMFSAFSNYLFSCLEQKRSRTAYRFLGLGDVAFVQDADASDALVALSSLVGKWVRDTLTRRVVRYHARTLPLAREVSGYHDPVTAAFIRETDGSRATSKFPDECFERTRAEKPTSAERANARRASTATA